LSSHSITSTKFLYQTRDILLLALCYAVSGKLAVMLALPPGYATAFFPTAGIALAAVLSKGARILPGIVLGSFALNTIQGLQSAEHLTAASMMVALAVAGGSALQAWIGASLYRRTVKPELDSSRDVLLFLILAPCICVVSASIAIPFFYGLHIMQQGALLTNWLTWWIGDTIGVLLAAPLTWIVIGMPRALWWRRRWMLLVPMVIGSAAFIAMYVKASEWEQDKLNQRFFLKSQQVADALQFQFEEHERLMQALASALSQKTSITAIEFDEIAHGYLDQRPDLRSMSWSPRVTDKGRAQFEQWAKKAINPDYMIKHKGADGQWYRAPQNSEYFPILFVEPFVQHEATLGYDKLSDPIGAASLQQAVQLGIPTASRMVDLVLPDGGHKGILLSKAIYLKASNNTEQTIGILSMVVQIDPYLAHAIASADFPYFLLKLEDRTNAAVEILVNTLPPNSHTVEFQKALELGGRHYLVTLAPNNVYLTSQQGWQSWSALVSGLILIGLLGAFLLLISGQRAHIEEMVTDRTRKLHVREARLQAILNNAADAILTIDQKGIMISANGAAGILFGYTIEHMHGLPFDQIAILENLEPAPDFLTKLSDRTQSNVELIGCKEDGTRFPMAISVSLVEAEDEKFFVCMLRDLTEQYRSQERIYQLAHHDSLTGLANRFRLNQGLESLLSLARRGQAHVAVMFIDLDYFKKINDSLGHQVGDLLLKEAAYRLKGLLRETDIVARLGGDEFVVVLSEYEAINNVSALAERVINELARPYLLAEHKWHSAASVGISLYPSDGADGDTLLRNADAAMYVAKGKGRNNYQFFSSELNALAHQRLRIENQIWMGLERHEFELYLQPQIHLASRKIIGAEALIRWRHPEMGMVAPDRFIPIAEESGLILPLGEWVLQQALQILAGWQRSGLPDLRLSINLSARQCNSGTLIASLDRLQVETGVDLQHLEVEITETAAMQDPQSTAELLHQMRSRGIKVAIDDFGTGYSSLSYLKLFAIDRIKIDRSFVMDIENDQNDALIASATIALAHSLDLGVIAEGVETEGQCAFLNHELCDEAQGYLFGKPMPVASFNELVKSSAIAMA
jgi:diguanylate cyclase (GGDEF)-like protein/PAS domain S-box-containing protein